MGQFAKLRAEDIPPEVREARNRRRAQSERARGDIEKHIPVITAVVIEKAEAGDMRAARLCMDKAIGDARSEPGVKIAGVDDPDPQVASDSVMTYLGRGDINPEQAVNYLTAIEKRFEIRLLSRGLTISGEQLARLMQLRELLRGRPFAPLVPSVSIGATFGNGN